MLKTLWDSQNCLQTYTFIKILPQFTLWYECVPNSHGWFTAMGRGTHPVMDGTLYG